MIDSTKTEHRTRNGNRAVVNRIIYCDAEGDVMYRGYTWDDFGKREDGSKIPGPMIGCWWNKNGEVIDPWYKKFDLEAAHA